jgi:hypothetical protein
MGQGMMGGKIPRLHLDEFILSIIYKKSGIYGQKHRKPA